MLTFIIGFLTGAYLTLIIYACLVAAGNRDDLEKPMEDKND